jgi:outer membrane protein TolC
MLKSGKFTAALSILSIALPSGALAQNVYSSPGASPDSSRQTWTSNPPGFLSTPPPGLTPDLKPSTPPAKPGIAPAMAPILPPSPRVPRAPAIDPKAPNAVVPEPDVQLDEAKVFDEDSIVVSKPQLQALISITPGLSPLELDAASTKPISLHEAVTTTLASNLDIGISASSETSQRWNYYGAVSRFLPDLPLSFYYLYLLGRLNIFPSFGSEGTKLNGPVLLMSPGIRLPLFQGGQILFGALQGKHNYRAAGYSTRATISNALLSTAQDYYNLVLNEAILQIRIKAVRTSEEQLRQNTSLHEEGLATSLDVLQAKTQMAKDRQSLIDQQVTRRNSAIQLAHDMNASMAVDLTPSVSLVRKIRLVAANLKIADLLKLAIDNRPELKQYEELRLAAKKAITVAAAPLLPQINFTGNLYAINNKAFGSSGSSGAAGMAGTGGTGASGSAAAVTSSPSSSGGLSPIFVFGLRANWNFNNLGVRDYTNVQAARATARQSHLQATKELTDVIEQVRNSYLASLSSEKKIEEATNEVSSSYEALRLAQLRFQNGLGTNLDIIQAQRDYTQALIDKAQAIINYNIDQAQLLHDIGLVSLDNLCTDSPRVR